MNYRSQEDLKINFGQKHVFMIFAGIISAIRIIFAKNLVSNNSFLNQ
jgi:hypothetical protein